MEARAIDTHAHLFLKEFAADLEAVTYRAQQVCEAVLLPNLDTSTLPQLAAIVALAPGFYYGMIGLHPTHVGPDFEAQLAQLEGALERGSWVAIGEVGMDLYHTPQTRPWQEEALARQAEWARRYKLPLSIHFRQALEETLSVLQPFIGEVEGVFHCFTGSYEEAKRILDAGFYLGIGGVITYKSAEPLREALRKVPLERLLLETDSPYLAPVPHRGKRNESSYLLYIARTLAEVRGLPLTRVLEETSHQARTLFHLPYGKNGS